MADWIKRCDICQHRRHVTYLDRTPISPIPRAEVPFEHMFMDCLGPIFPDPLGPKPRYNYALLVVDSCTRFPFCQPLSNMSAKQVCDALLEVFQFTGIPAQMSSDNGSNFTAQLTQQFMAKLGCSPTFSLPFHPRAVGLSERAVGTLKSIIGKLAAQHPRSWHEQIKFALWAMRESVNATVGLSPWMLCFGRQMRGPCAILAETWTGTQPLPVNMGKSTVEYLLDLKSELEKGLEFAAEHSREAQEAYAELYNRKTRDKTFEIGDHVLILSPDSTKTKTFSRWQGPGKIIEVLSPHGYLVEVDNVRQKVHADRLRRYYHEVDKLTASDVSLGDELHVDTCAVIYERDEDFGDVQVLDPIPDGQCSDLPSQLIPDDELSHLSSQQRKELLRLLEQYAGCFSNIPGYTDKAVHYINVTADFKPKRLAQYRVPEKLKPEVDRQIKEMLALGIIQPSRSPMANPLVCVLKGPEGRDGVRLAIDYRYLNKYTIPDEFPVPDISSLLQEVRQAKFITTVDAKSGYWQTAVNPDDIWLTAFMCEGGLYEFTRTLFGARNAGSTFCRAIKEVLEPVKHHTKSYVDDMVTFSMQWDQHLQDLEAFLKVIKGNGIILSLKKCHFAKPSTKVCGQIVGSGQRRTDPDKVLAVLQLVSPRTKTELRSLLGAFNYFREYLPNFATRALPLTQLTGKDVPTKIPWGPREQSALEDLKRALADAAQQSLSIINWSQPFTIHCDASEHTVAGVLSQPDEEGKENPIAFYSIKLNKQQRNWSVVEKEAYAALLALKKFRGWVWGAIESTLQQPQSLALPYTSRKALN